MKWKSLSVLVVLGVLFFWFAVQYKDIANHGPLNSNKQQHFYKHKSDDILPERNNGGYKSEVLLPQPSTRKQSNEIKIEKEFSVKPPIVTLGKK